MAAQATTEQESGLAEVILALAVLRRKEANCAAG